MMDRIKAFLDRFPTIRRFADKVMKDNIGMLASVVAWTLLTSIVPIVAGLVAISSLFVRDPAAQRALVDHLRQALQGAISRNDLENMVRLAVQHTGLLGLIGLLGILWGGSNLGGAISTVFQPIFLVRGRSFIHERLIDFGMIFVFTALMVVIVAGTTASALLDRFFSGAPISDAASFVIGTAVSLVAAFLLFSVIYVVFPNIRPRFKLRTVWRGALVAAILFQILSYVWPIYTRVSHFTRYGAVLASLLVLTAWIYFFSIILLVGAEVVALGALDEARKSGQEVGPGPDGTVPQRIETSEEQRDQAAETRR